MVIIVIIIIVANLGAIIIIDVMIGGMNKKVREVIKVLVKQELRLPIQRIGCCVGGAKRKINMYITLYDMIFDMSFF